LASETAQSTAKVRIWIVAKLQIKTIARYPTNNIIPAPPPPSDAVRASHRIAPNITETIPARINAGIDAKKINRPYFSVFIDLDISN
jgi:hypothetical protein